MAVIEKNRDIRNNKEIKIKTQQYDHRIKKYTLNVVQAYQSNKLR